MKKRPANLIVGLVFLLGALLVISLVYYFNKVKNQTIGGFLLFLLGFVLFYLAKGAVVSGLLALIKDRKVNKNQYIKFESICVKPALRRRFEEAARELSVLNREEYQFLVGRSGQTFLSRTNGIALTTLITSSRPATSTLVAIDEDQNIFLPSVRARDFEILRKRLGFESEGEIEELRSLVHPLPTELR